MPRPPPPLPPFARDAANEGDLRKPPPDALRLRRDPANEGDLRRPLVGDTFILGADVLFFALVFVAPFALVVLAWLWLWLWLLL